jgi:hypothetical protein
VAKNTAADLHVLQRHDRKSPLRTGYVASLQKGGVHQLLDFRFLAAWIKNWPVAAGIQLQQKAGHKFLPCI